MSGKDFLNDDPFDDWDDSELEELQELVDTDTTTQVSVANIKPVPLPPNAHSPIVPTNPLQGQQTVGMQPTKLPPFGEVKILCKYTGGDGINYGSSCWVLFFHRPTKETHKMRIDTEKIWPAKIKVPNKKLPCDIFRVDADTYIEVNEKWKAWTHTNDARDLWDKLVNFGFEHCTVPHRVVRQEAKEWD